MFLQAIKVKDCRLEPIQLKFGPQVPRQHTPDGLSKIGMFNSTLFQGKKSVEKKKESNQRRPQSSFQRITKPAFYKNVFTVQYIFFCENGNNGNLVRRILQGRAWFCEQQTSYNVNFIWRQSNKGFNYSTLTSKSVCINHLEHHNEISNKNKLHANLKSYCLRTNRNMDDFVPVTFIINLDSTTLQNDFKKFVDYFVEIKKDKQLKNVWLLKPPDLNRGRGIQLFSDLKVLINQIDEFCKTRSVNKQIMPSSRATKTLLIQYPESNEKTGQAQIEFTLDQTPNQDRILVLQKYLETPLLYNGRKFDFRIWVLIDHSCKYYIFKEGYLRLASEHFDINNLKSLYIHLTNNAIQKNHHNYCKYELGNQLSFQDLQQYLTSQKNTKVSSVGIVQKMKELIHQTIFCACTKLRNNHRDFQFEIFGYDFMIDNNGNIWLIEINTNPCIEESSPLLQKLIPRMLNDAFRLTIDKIFSPFKTTQDNFLNNLHEFSIPGYGDRDNLWDYLGQI
ncbi:unnamed protein product [Paramecium octaurelia]|uniref:Tubulin-tyrosine ligase n=1 Tax=Paramecium octaurelia TaxID=43137 RepID=A0A8S1VDX3_PAROT|nr:unnamed protein product [Paramecium octaurelia]